MSTGRYRKIKKIQAYFSHFKAAWLEKTWLPFLKKKESWKKSLRQFEFEVWVVSLGANV